MIQTGSEIWSWVWRVNYSGVQCKITAGRPMGTPGKNSFNIRLGLCKAYFNYQVMSIAVPCKVIYSLGHTAMMSTFRKWIKRFEAKSMNQKMLGALNSPAIRSGPGRTEAVFIISVIIEKSVWQEPGGAGRIPKEGIRRPSRLCPKRHLRWRSAQDPEIM